MSTPTLDKLLEELDREPEAAKRLAQRLAADLASEEQLRTLLLEALLHEAATKEDLERLEERLSARIDRLEDQLRSEIHHLEERMDSLMKWMIGLLATIWGTLLAAAITALKLLAAKGG